MSNDKLFYFKKICAYGLPSGAVNVYRSLLNFANRETMECYPSVKTIARDTSMGVSTVRRHLKLLEDEGLIDRVSRKRKNNNGCTSNIFKLR